MAARKRIKPAVGQVVAIPLLDGTFGIGHVAAYDRSIKVALFARRGRSPEELRAVFDDALREGPVATLEVTSDELRDGEWPVIGQREPNYPAELLDKKGVSHTAAVARSLLSAYNGLLPWDGLFDPQGYAKLLLPGVQVPPTVRYKADVFTTAQSARTTMPAPVTEGPAEIHIQILYPGEGPPDTELLRRRQALERALEALGAGEVTDAGGGGGVMDVYITTDEVRRAIPIVERAISDLGFTEDTLIETGPPDEDED